MSDTQATFFATIIDEWVRDGLTDAVVSAGRRSTLLAGLLEVHPDVRVHVIVDERSAAFFALGLSIANRRPTLLWCTSGSAPTEYGAAVMEAHHSRVPLLVCTADRPPELRHVRDWQATDQRYLFLGATRWSFDPGTADEAMRNSWRSIASRAFVDTMYHPNGPGPVHLNLPIREPWTFDVGTMPDGRDDNAAWHRADVGVTRPPIEVVRSMVAGRRRGVIIAGKTEMDVELVHRCASQLGWPVFAEARSLARIGTPTAISSYDSLLRVNDFASQQVPEVVVRLGMPVLSKLVPEWTREHGAEEWLITPFDEWTGSTSASSRIVRADIDELCRSILELAPDATDSSWLDAWQSAEQLARGVIDGSFAEDETPTEPAVALELCSVLSSTPNALLFAATSSPVRDVEWYLPPSSIEVVANRGVSGLEGLISTAAGLSVGRAAPALLLVGDLGFLYDIGALWALKGASEEPQLTVVVVDNDGGRLFDTFPELQGLGPDVFSRVALTPHRTDIVAAVAGMGVSVVTVTEMSSLGDVVRQQMATGGTSVVHVSIDNEVSSKMRRSINQRVAEALKGSW